MQLKNGFNIQLMKIKQLFYPFYAFLDICQVWINCCNVSLQSQMRDVILCLLIKKNMTVLLTKFETLTYTKKSMDCFCLTMQKQSNWKHASEGILRWGIYYEKAFYLPPHYRQILKPSLAAPNSLNIKRVCTMLLQLLIIT